METCFELLLFKYIITCIFLHLLVVLDFGKHKTRFVEQMFLDISESAVLGRSFKVNRMVVGFGGKKF